MLLFHKQGETEMELYYTTDGVLTKEVPDTDDHTDMIPVALPEELAAEISKNFPGLECIESEFEDEIAAEDMEQEIPETVLQAMIEKVPDLADYELDEVEVTENAKGIFYEFELENKTNDDDEIEMTIDGNGKIVAFEKD